MALRDQPYIPLYVKDIMTDEKLNECSASTHGIYIKGIMCLMHKSENYGKILLKQKYKQGENICLNFAKQLAKHFPYSVEEIDECIQQLLDEKVCYIEDDFLCQKRMIKDYNLSLIRAKAGKKGGETTSFAIAKHKAKPVANSVNANASVNESKDDTLNDVLKEVFTHWNESKIIIHQKLTDPIKTKIKTTLKNYTVDQIKTSITNYSKIIHDDQYYFKYKWLIVDFLQRGIEKFLDFEIASNNYKHKEDGNGTRGKRSGDDFESIQEAKDNGYKII